MSKKNKLHTICDNPRLYCLQGWYSLPKHMVCTCGWKLHEIGTHEGARLKVLRKLSKRPTSAGRVKR